MKNNQKAFTLVELSIVIVIIGLIVAGVTAGRSLVRQAQLRSITTKANEIKASVNSFKLQYEQLPGDFDNAFSFWSSCSGGTSASCNGNHDGHVDFTTTDSTDEAYPAWHHLQLAGLSKASVTGLSSSNDGVAIIGTNIPKSALSGVGISLIYNPTLTLSSSNVNTILFGRTNTTLANGAAISAPEAQSIDTKTDDGVAVTGAIFAVGVAGTSASDCVDTDATPDAYNVDSTTAAPCAIGFQF